MTINEKMKIIDNKIDQNNGQYNFDRQTTENSALSSGNNGKCKFVTSEDVLREKRLLEKVHTTKSFECSSLGSELKKETDITKNDTKD